MHDIVIRGGTIVDGTGVPAFAGDVAIDGDRIASVGGKAAPARRDISAEGQLVTPGWVDPHTHYDGQATWDSMLAPSSWHGVTTLMFGNCGVGFAPARKQDHNALIDLMEGVEDIPGVALAEGLKWDWESFPQFLDALDRQPRVVDIAAQVPHHPLRVFAMGARAIRREAATDDDIRLMRDLTEEALRAGAFGFTTSRTDQHKTPDGELVPARNAEAKELLGIGSALGAVGRGTFGMLSDFEDERAEFAWMKKLARDTGRPVWFLLTDRVKDPNRLHRLMNEVHASRERGAVIVGQVAGRPVGVILGIAATVNPFGMRPSYRRYEHLPLAERLERLRDPVVRREILADAPSAETIAKLPPVWQTLCNTWHSIFVLNDPPDYEPGPELSIQGIAKRAGLSCDEVAYDYLTAGPDRFLYFPVTNYIGGDHARVREMLLDPATILGLSDGGAHCGAIIDAGMPSFMLTHWVRDRHRGPKLPLEMIVKRQTSEPAEFFGLPDRGKLVPGLRADVNVIDFDALRLYKPEIIHDLPAGGRRFVQRVDGYKHTLLGGIQIFEGGQHTGALPGRLLRAGR
jgi:N-acyl-D-aspartate/D-glutamate deacylase